MKQINQIEKINQVDKEIDLRGEVCPYTFLKTLLALEDMENGQILKVRLNFPAAAENVPRSISNEGHLIISIKEVKNKEWEIIIQKQDV